MACICCSINLLKNNSLNILKAIVSDIANECAALSKKQAKNKFENNEVISGYLICVRNMFKSGDLGFPISARGVVRVDLILKALDQNEIVKHTPRYRFLSYFFEEVMSARDRLEACECAIESDHLQKLQNFEKQTKSKLDKIIQQKKDQLEVLRDVKITCWFEKSNKVIQIEVFFEFVDEPMAIVFRGKDVIARALNYLKLLDLPSFDVECLNNDEKVDIFIQSELRPVLNKFWDYASVDDITVHTSKRFKWRERVLFKKYFNQKERYLIDIRMNSGEIVRTTLRSLNITKEKFIRHLQPDIFRIMNDVMRLDSILHAKQVQSITVEIDNENLFDDTNEKESSRNKCRYHALIKYTDGTTQIIRHLANRRKSDNPLIVLPNEKVNVSAPTHLIIYLWSASLCNKKGHQKEIAHKIGITSLNILGDGNYLADDLIAAVEKRIKEYRRYHNLRIKDVDILYISEPEFIANGKQSKIKNLEKRIVSEEFKLRKDLSSSDELLEKFDSDPRELMISLSRKIDVPDYFSELASEMIAPLSIIEIDTRVYLPKLREIS